MPQIQKEYIETRGIKKNSRDRLIYQIRFLGVSNWFISTMELREE